MSSTIGSGVIVPSSLSVVGGVPSVGGVAAGAGAEMIFWIEVVVVVGTSKIRTEPVLFVRLSSATPIAGRASPVLSLRKLPAVVERVSLSPVFILPAVTDTFLKVPVIITFRYSPGLIVVGSVLTAADSSRLKSDRFLSAIPTIVLSFSNSVAAATVIVGWSPNIASTAPVK